MLFCLRELNWQTSGKKTDLFERKILLWRKMKKKNHIMSKLWKTQTLWKHSFVNFLRHDILFMYMYAYVHECFRSTINHLRISISQRYMCTKNYTFELCNSKIWVQLLTCYLSDLTNLGHFIDNLTPYLLLC